MNNNFFNNKSDHDSILKRLHQLEKGKVGFYSVGLYPASLAYNCAMQTDGSQLLLAPRPNRKLLGAFSSDVLNGMDPKHIDTLNKMGTHYEDGKLVDNNLSDLLLRCELVVLSANSKHIENDLIEACRLRKTLNREDVVLTILSGSFTYDENTDQSYVLCEKNPEIGFFSGFHRHDALRNPLDSFSANFCHPNAITSLLGARMLDRISPNIQVASGVHNIEAQYLKAAKNIASIFAGFGYYYYSSNPGLLPTLLTLLLSQCLDQAANVSISRKNKDKFYNGQPFPITGLGYGVERIEAAILRDGELEKVRDHTFSQLSPMIADIWGSMMQPVHGNPTRNFQAGQVLAKKMNQLGRCPIDMQELLAWCNEFGLKKGDLEGLNSLKMWPQILKRYSIPSNDSSINNLLYMIINAPREHKNIFYDVVTKTRELTNYCQYSVRPNMGNNDSSFSPSSLSLEYLANCIESGFQASCSIGRDRIFEAQNTDLIPSHLQAINIIENHF